MLLGQYRFTGIKVLSPYLIALLKLVYSNMETITGRVMHKSNTVQEAGSK